MHIISISPQYKSNTSFKGPVYREIKYIPKIRCACCDRKMINPIDHIKAFTSITKPLSEMLKKGYLSYWQKNPEIGSLLESLAEKFPNFSLDKIMIDRENRIILKKTLANQICKQHSSELRNLSDYERFQFIDNEVLSQYRDLINHSRENLKGASAVMKRMAKFKQCLDGEKLATFEQLEIYAQKYPRKTLKEILHMDEVYKFHKTMDLLQRAEKREKLNYHFKNIEKLIKKIDPNADELIYNLKNSVLELLAHQRDIDSRIYYAKQIYKEALAQYKNKKLEEQVMKELEQIPTNFVNKDSFLAFAKNHNYSDNRIISSLLVPSEVSFEHIIPRSANGEDDATNGIVLCRDCNQKRGSIPYNEFIQYHPQMPYNTQKQIQIIANYILKGRLDPIYRFWPIKVAQTLEEFTNGIIKPDISEYAKKALKQSNKRINNNNQELNLIKEEQNEILQQLKSLKYKLDELKEEKDYIKEQSEIENFLNYTINEYLEKQN